MAEPTCITTWLYGTWPKGCLLQRYRLAFRSALRPGELTFSLRSYSTPETARRSAKRQGLNVLPGIADGHQRARAKLGLPKQDETTTTAQTRAWMTANPDRQVLVGETV